MNRGPLRNRRAVGSDLARNPEGRQVSQNQDKVAYVTGRFLGVDIAYPADVLAPREETELLGRAAIEILRGRPGPARVVDMCCGSGNLACAVATACDAAIVWACDLMPACVAAAAHNVDRLGLSNRVQVRRGDLFAALPIEDFDRSIDLVICNPPYIPSLRLDGDKAHLLDAEPREAFDGGLYGFTIHQRVIGSALRYLRPGGWVALEFGERQEKQIAALFRRAGGYHDLQYRCDPRGVPRVAVAQRDGSPTEGARVGAAAAPPDVRDPDRG
ncbi:HemK family putative methylases [Methylobacterium sp. yr596]|nr:HemK family putative methylases [Methylobacterium sp. yr596]